MWAARAALAAGFDSTSNVIAALKLNSKPSGTMAHSLVMAFGAISGSEDEAFSAFQRYFPTAPLLIDTYDTIAAAERLAEKVKSGTTKVAGVRLDSGDLASLSKQVRSLLPEAKIFASGDLDEWEIAELKANGAIIDGYGVGTKLVTGTPVNGVYKLVQIDDVPTMKQSSKKETYPGRKQVFRRYAQIDGTAQIQCDRLGLASEKAGDGETPLLQLVMKQGQRIQEAETLSTIRDRVAATVASLPAETRQLHDPKLVPMDVSDALRQMTAEVEQRLEQEAK
jgi:nicotinate phosphoribosyltransferase